MRRQSSVALPFSVRLGGPHPLCFGTGRSWNRDWREGLPREIGEELRLFVLTWAAGFLGFSLFLA
jgi:hypothetical protein